MEAVQDIARAAAASPPIRLQSAHFKPVPDDAANGEGANDARGGGSFFDLTRLRWRKEAAVPPITGDATKTGGDASAANLKLLRVAEAAVDVEEGSASPGSTGLRITTGDDGAEAPSGSGEDSDSRRGSK